MAGSLLALLLMCMVCVCDTYAYICAPCLAGPTHVVYINFFFCFSNSLLTFARIFAFSSKQLQRKKHRASMLSVRAWRKQCSSLSAQKCLLSYALLTHTMLCMCVHVFLLFLSAFFWTGCWRPLAAVSAAHSCALQGITIS